MLQWVCLLFALVCSGAALAAEPIRIAVTGPFTGGSAQLGLSMRDGIRLATAEINKAGGLLGRKLELIERDDEAIPERGAQAVQDLLAHYRIHAALGVVNTGVGLACQRFYQEARIPMITSVATGSVLTRQFMPPQYPENYIFRISAQDIVQSEIIVAEAVDKRGLKRVAIFHDTTSYGEGGRADLERALYRRNLTPLTIEKFNIGERDMSSQLRRAKAIGAEAILTYGIGPELAQVANGRAQLGWKVPIIGSWTLGSPAFIDSAGPNAEGARMPQTLIDDTPNPTQRAFIQKFLRFTGQARIPSPTAAAQGYDSVYLLAAAIRQAKSTSGPAIREALESLRKKVPGVVTTYDRPYTQLDHEAIDTPAPVTLGEVRNGRVSYAYEAQRAATVAR